MKYLLKIKECRIRKGFSQRELAKRLHISYSFLSELEKGKYDIKLSVLLDITKVLNVDIKELYEKIE